MKNLFKNAVMKLLFAFVATMGVCSVHAAMFGTSVASIVQEGIGLTYVGTYAIIELVSLVAPMGVLGADVYSSTVLQAARAFIKDENNKKFELRPELSKIIDAFTRDREFTIPALDDIRQAKTQTTTALYLKSKDFTINSSKTCSPSGEQSGSGTVAVSWSEKAFVVKTT